jgi:DNA invertase Pin-like site-specific DNA recombinase
VRYVIYLRVSTDQQADTGHGLAVQEDACRAWLRKQGHKLAAIHTDIDRSGGDEIGARPGLAAAAALLALDKADGLLVYRLDRLARDLILQEQLLSELHRGGKELRSCSPAEDDSLIHDPDDPTRALVRRILGAIAQYERELIRLRLRRGKAQKALAGGYVGGSPAYGWTVVRGKLVPVPDEQKALRLMMKLLDQGVSYRGVCAELTRRGIEPRGRKWQPNTVWDIVKRERARKGRAISAPSPTPEPAEERLAIA